MARSKLVKKNEQIAETVVNGYQKIEKSVVNGFTRMSDRFVDQYLTKEGETVEEAKAHLNREQEERQRSSQQEHPHQ